MILTDDNFATIVKAVELGRALYDNLMRYIRFQMAVLFGFIANRLNVSITGMEAASGVHYMPRWTEVAITLAICAIGFAVFRWAVLNLPVFEEKE